MEVGVMRTYLLGSLFIPLFYPLFNFSHTLNFTYFIPGYQSVNTLYLFGYKKPV